MLRKSIEEATEHLNVSVLKDDMLMALNSKHDGVVLFSAYRPTINSDLLDDERQRIREAQRIAQDFLESCRD